MKFILICLQAAVDISSQGCWSPSKVQLLALGQVHDRTAQLACNRIRDSGGGRTKSTGMAHGKVASSKPSNPLSDLFLQAGVLAANKDVHDVHRMGKTDFAKIAIAIGEGKVCPHLKEVLVYGLGLCKKLLAQTSLGKEVPPQQPLVPGAVCISQERLGALHVTVGSTLH